MRWLGVHEPKSVPHALRQRGYRVAYHGDRVNHCPGCGRSQWHVGRFSAECAFCATAIPLATQSGRQS